MKFFAIASCMLPAIFMPDGASAQNTDRVRSSERINGDAAFAVRTKSSTPQADARCGAFDAGWGPCSTYAPGGSNYNYCNSDTDACLGLQASEACDECAECPAFNAGWGTCDTYAPGGSNYNYCDSDTDACLGLQASEACGECDECPPWFDAGSGTCDTYAPGQPNNGKCGYNDYDSCLGEYADDACYGCWDSCLAFDIIEGTSCGVSVELYHWNEQVGDWDLLEDGNLYNDEDEYCWKGLGESVDAIDMWIHCDDDDLLIDRAWLVDSWGQTVQSWDGNGNWCLSTNPLDILQEGETCYDGLSFEMDGSVEFNPY